MNRNGLRGIVLMASSLAAGQAAAQALAPVSPATVGAGGVVTSPLDNPAFTASYPLGMTPRVQMAADSNGNAWFFRGFGLWGQVACAAGDTVCTANSGAEKLPVGLLTPGNFTMGMTIAPEVHGAKLGPAAATVSLFQEKDAPISGDPPVPSQAASIPAQLAAGTIVVPVNVVVVVPATTMPDERRVMLPLANPAISAALFDDVWSADTARFPSAILENQGFFTTKTGLRTTATTQIERVVKIVTNSSGTFSSSTAPVGILPDDVFAQCGIQFRMVDFVTIEETDPTFVRRIQENGPGSADDTAFCAGGGGPLGGGSAGQLIRHLKAAAAPKLKDPNLITVMFNFRVDTPSCANHSGLCCFDHTKGATSFHDIVVGVEDMAETTATAHLVVAHELGHALTLDHTPCDTAEKKNLMCDGAEFVEFHIPGCDSRDGATVTPAPFNCTPRAEDAAVLMAASCTKARAGTLGIQPDTTPPVVDAGPDQTLECTSAAGAQATLSGTATDAESGISNQGWFNGSMSLGNTASVTVTAPIGTTTYRKFALNGKSLSAEDTVAVTVRDTKPPTLTGAATVTVAGCETGGNIALTVPTATDTCSTGLTVTGSVIQSGGANLPTPIPVTNGQVVLQPGTHVVEWRSTDPAGNVGTLRQTVSVASCMASGDSMQMFDRSKLTTPSGNPVTIVNYGTGVMDIGADAKVGAIISRGSVTVRDRAVVSGSIRTGGTLTRLGTPTITGTVTERATIVLPPAPTITNAWPTTNSGPVNLEPGTTRSLTPGSYAALTVKTNAVLTLAPGTYFFTSVTLEPSGSVKLSGTTTVEVRDGLTLRGIFRDAANQLAKVAVRYRGTAVANIEVSFFGSILAPSATVVLGGGVPEIRGQIFARRLEIRPDISVRASSLAGPSLLTLSPPGGCDCSTSGGRPTAGGAALLALALALAARRRRRA